MNLKTCFSENLRRSGIHSAELSLLCDGVHVQDDEVRKLTPMTFCGARNHEKTVHNELKTAKVLLSSHMEALSKPPPQLQLLRIFRPSHFCQQNSQAKERGNAA